MAVTDKYAEVVKYLRRKTANGFDPITYLGAEQRFVGALRNSGINNLEEQFIIGTDTYTETYFDTDGNEVIEKSFHINDSSHSISDYYKLISVIYKDGTNNENFFFDNEEINFPNDPDEVIFGNGLAYPDKTTLYGNIGTTDPSVVPAKTINTLTFENNNLKVNPSSYTVVKKEELHYISNNGLTDLLVLTKITGKRYTNDGLREIVRENITNHLTT